MNAHASLPRSALKRHVKERVTSQTRGEIVGHGMFFKVLEAWINGALGIIKGSQGVVAAVRQREDADIVTFGSQQFVRTDGGRST